LGKVRGSVFNTITDEGAAGNMLNLDTDLVQVFIQIWAHPGQYCACV
jgi:hypothetical protein